MNKHTFIRSYNEVENTRTFVFEKGETTWQAGQYQTYVLSQAGETETANQRFFTIASAPSEAELHISTRISDSAFKQTLNALQPGDSIEAHSVEGDFTWTDETNVVLVAGGIGVTPYRSMLVERDATGQSLDATLLYFGRTSEFAFRQEFDAIAERHPELNVQYIVAEPITAATIMRLAPQAKTNVTYLSGAEPMVDSVGEDLKSLGVTLKQDWLPGYTDKTY